MTSLGDIDVACTETDGLLYIGTVSMNRPAWAMLDLTPLWAPAQQRGEDLLIPGRPGLVAMPKRVTGTDASLRMIINGNYNYLGAATTNSRRGLFDNIDYLNNHVVTPPASTRTVSLYLPGSSTEYMSGKVHVTSLELGEQVGGFCKAILNLSIPDGRLAVTL